MFAAALKAVVRCEPASGQVVFVAQAVDNRAELAMTLRPVEKAGLERIDVPVGRGCRGRAASDGRPEA